MLVLLEFVVLHSRLLIHPRFREIDQGGSVTATSLIPWLECGRAALLKEQGLNYREFEADGYLMPVLEVALILHAPAFFDDALHLTTMLRERPLFRFRLDYELRRGDVLLVTAHTVQAFVNRDYQPVRPPPSFRAKVKQMFPPEWAPENAAS